MTHYDISLKSHPEEYCSYDSRNDIMSLWLGGLVTAEQVNSNVLHELIHAHLDAAHQHGKQTSSDEDHFIIDVLVAEGYLDVV